MKDLRQLLAALDAEAPAAERHLWLIDLLAWVRGSRRSVPAAVSRVELLLDALETDPAAATRFRGWWRQLLGTVDFTTLLADFGFASRAAFTAELVERIRRKILPLSPDTVDAGELFTLALPSGFDAAWIAALDGTQLARLGALLAGRAGELGTADAAIAWRRAVLDAVTYCAGQILSSAFSPDVRLRLSAEARSQRPFHTLLRDVQAVRSEVLRTPRDEVRMDEALRQLRAGLESGRAALATVYTHFEDNGISVDLVFRMRQLRERALRVRELLDCVTMAGPAPRRLAPGEAEAPAGPPAARSGERGGTQSTSVARLMGRLVQLDQERRSVRSLIASNSSLLAAKVVERSAETGEHYIASDRAGYAAMLRKAAGGGAITAGTVLLKFAVGALALSAFWNGFWSGSVYAASFVLIQLLHFTLATKQPAMTAPAMAAKLKELGSRDAVDGFVDQVTHLVRTQVAAVLGNVLVVMPLVLAVGAAVMAAAGHALLSVHTAEHVLHALHPAGPLLAYAAFTGAVLFAASIVGGWTENWFVLHRLHSALRHNPQIVRWLGAARAARWADFMRANISGLASSVSLGFMLGLIPAFSAFFGLALDVRHVTLSAGQLAAAAVSLGPAVLREPAFWWCLAGIPFIGALNLSVSFYLAFRLALRAHNVSNVNRARIRAAIWDRWRTAPWSFFVPRRTLPGTE